MMTKRSVRVLIISSIVILLPIVYGAMNYAQLPADMVTHWGVRNEPNGWMPKVWAVYGLPGLMLALQWFIVIVMRINAKKTGGSPRLERLVQWLIPVLSVVLYITTIRANLGFGVDIRRIAVGLVGAMFVLMGNYLPTVPANGKTWGYHPTTNLKPDLQAKVNRKMGQAMVIGGLLCLLSLFFSEVVSWLAVAIAIVSVIGVSIYGLRLPRR